MNYSSRVFLYGPFALLLLVAAATGVHWWFAAAALEKRLSDALGLNVSVDHREQGGRLEIRYKTLEQLDNICVRLTGS